MARGSVVHLVTGVERGTATTKCGREVSVASGTSIREHGLSGWWRDVTCRTCQILM